MNKILLFCLILVSSLSGCQKDDELSADEKPDARLSQTLEDYKAQLVNSEYGWKAVLQPGGGAGYSFLFKFGANDRVSTLSDVNATAAATALESTYRLKAQQRPTLIFDTYTYLHILSDPNETVSGGDRGAGKYSDFEFSIDEVTPETITLTGTLQNSKMVLTKATREDAANFIRNTAAMAKAFENISDFNTYYFKRLTIGNVAYDISADTNLRQITITYFEGETAKTFTTDYYYTETGLAFLTPFTGGGANITNLTAIQYNATTRTINLTVNNVAGTIQESIRPAKINVQAARNFFNATGEDYWLAETGFTVNGVPDAYKVSSIANFYFIAFWPKFDTSNGQAYDLFGVVTLAPNADKSVLSFGPTAVSRLTSDGRIVYTYLKMWGEQPAETEPIITPTTQLWTDTRGFYVVTTEYGIDLVSAKDGKSWIHLYQ